VLPATSSSTTSETFGQRFSAWSYGLQAIVHRPLFGFGPDQFRAATLPHYTTAFAANNGQSYFLDGHNIFVEYLVTIGIVGLAALVAWLVLAVSGRRGALLVFALVLLASELVEPLTVVIAPLAFLALGAAPVLREATSGGDRAVEQVPRWASVAGLALGGVALVAGATFTVGDVAYQRAIGLGNSRQYTAGAADAHTASTLLPLWPDPAETLSQLDAVNAAETAPGTGLRVPVAAHWAQVAVDRDPTNPANLLWLATMLSIDHRYRAAKTALQEGRQADPNYVPDLDLLAAYDLRDGDRRAADAILEESLKIDPRQGIVGGILSRRCGAALPGALPDSPFSLTCQLNP